MQEIPRDVVDENGDVLPSYADDLNAPKFPNDQIVNASGRLMARLDQMTNDQRLAAAREDRFFDQQNTFPGTGPLEYPSNSEAEDIEEKFSKQEIASDEVKFTITGPGRIRGEYQGRVMYGSVPASQEDTPGYAESIKKDIEARLKAGEGNPVKK